MRNVILLVLSLISFSALSLDDNSLSKPILIFSKNCNSVTNAQFKAGSNTQFANQLIYVGCRDTNSKIKVLVFKTYGSVDELNVRFEKELPANDSLVVELTSITNNITEVYPLFGSQVTKAPIASGFAIDSAWDVLSDPDSAAAIIAEHFQASGRLSDHFDVISAQIKQLQDGFSVTPGLFSFALDLTKTVVITFPGGIETDPLDLDVIRTIVIKFPDGTETKFEVIIESNALSSKLPIGLKAKISKDASGKFIPTNVQLLLRQLSDSLISANNVGDLSAFIDFITLHGVKVNYLDRQLDPDLKGTIGEVCKVTHVTKQGIKVPEVTCTNGG